VLRVVLWVFGVLFALNIIGKMVGSTTSGGGSSSAVACPSEVAQGLTGETTLVARYRTDKHTVTLCRDTSGQVWYDGRVTGAAITPSTHILLKATPTANGYVANNSGYGYEIDGTQLTTTKSGKVLSHDQLTLVSP